MGKRGNPNKRQRRWNAGAGEARAGEEEEDCARARGGGARTREQQQQQRSRASADRKKCERIRGRFVEPRGVGFTARTGIGRGNERTNERATRGTKFRCPKFEDLEQYVNLPVEGPLRVTMLVSWQ